MSYIVIFSIGGGSITIRICTGGGSIIMRIGTGGVLFRLCPILKNADDGITSIIITKIIIDIIMPLVPDLSTSF